MKKTILLLSVLSTLMLIPTLLFANGFGINETGAKAVGMGGAFAAQADDPSAVYFNPAGITQLDGINLSVGVSVIAPAASFKDDSDGKVHNSEKPVFFIPNIYYTHQINDQLSAGLGVFANFGLATAWEDDFSGRYLLGGRKGSVETISVNPVLAYEVIKGLSFSAGPVFQHASATFESNIDMNTLTAGAITDDADLHLKELEDQSWGWNVAVHYILNENWKFGASYRSSIKHDLKGDGETSGLPDTGLLSLLHDKFNQSVSAELELPPIAYLAVAYSVNKWTFEFDAQWTGWSTYDELVVPELGKSSPKDWNDAWTYRFGTQYQLTEKYALRAGIIRDMSPIPGETFDMTLPSGDRWLLGCGLGMTFNKFTVDLAYNYLMDDGGSFDNEAGDDPVIDTKPRITGEFDDIDAHILSMSVSYTF